MLDKNLLKKNKYWLNESGYIALTSILIISAVVVLISVSISLLAISESQMSFSSQETEKASFLIESCVEDVLLRINEDTNFSGGSISIPQGNCTVTIVSSDPNWAFQVEGTFEDYSREVEVSVNRNPPNMVITNWIEVSN